MAIESPKPVDNMNNNTTKYINYCKKGKTTSPQTENNQSPNNNNQEKPQRTSTFDVYVTTTCFHIATLLANLFKKCQVEKVFVLYGTWVIWSGWAMCLWLINPDPLSPRTLTTGSTRGFYYINGNGTIVLYDFEAFIQPMDVSPFLMHGKWTSTTLPILSFFLLLAIRRNHWGLLTWEHLVVLESTNSLKYYRTWCIAGAGAGWILLWEAIKFWCHVPFAYTSSTDENIIFYRTDITRFPGLLNILLVCFVSGLFMLCWWSFWTFQYKGVVWKKELKEGVVVWSSNGLIQVGAYHLYQAEESLKTLKQVVSEPGWKKILTHKSGVVVSSKLGFNNLKIPLFMGEHIINGFTPQAIFSVIGMRKLWDEWYEEGNLVENLSDTTSCTYMVMKGMTVRDLSLVEKIECTPTGTISFIATSVDNPKVPCINGRIRAEIKLHGWILEPISFSPPKTKVSYVLQAQVNGWIPAVFVKKYMARRPVIIHTIESYLQKNGPPPMILSNTQDNSTRSSGDSYNNTENAGQRKKVNFSEQEDGEESKSKQLMFQNPSLTRNDRPNRSLSSLPTTPKEINYGSYPLMKRHKTGSVPKFSLRTHKSHDQIKQRQIPRSLQSHRHVESAYRTLEIFKILSSSHDDWDLYSEKQNTKIYMKNSRDSSPSLVRGETIIKGGFTPEDILSIIKSLDLKKYWDDRYDEGERIEILGNGDILSRVSMKGTFPICGRDLAIVTRNEKDPETGIIWSASSSVVDPLIPEDKNRVRANLELAGWKLRPIFDESIQEYAVEVIYIVDIDIKFDTVPVSILKTISSQTPMCVARIDELLNKIGHPPYVIKTSGEILSEELNTITYQYDLKIGSINSGSITEIKTSNIMHHGFNISVIPENSKVEVLSHNKNIIRITLPNVKVLTLDIKITRSTSGGGTFNGQSIPVVSSELIEEIILSKPIISIDPMEKYVPEFDFRDQPKIVDEKDQESSPKYIPQSINTETTPRYIPEYNFIENVIPSNSNEVDSTENENDQESSPKYIPQFINTKTTSRYIPEYDFIHNVISSNNKRDSSIPSSSTTRSSRRISSRITRIGINLSDYNEISFTPQETALMFFFMMVSYYAGKFNGFGCDSK
ncbi:2757_t:CDS:10 [Diversispora eburnea]|uniref:2757_t:CDS:1 n=1 Tax=Diversispora eburnea TaxID=1213867 RepID=A0A9N8YNM0_9GLOM|nr:2757_t:CDS:10 [Diversispora eburnea]